MTDFEERAEFEYVKVRVLNNVFSAENRKKRINAYVDEVYCKTDENRKLRKAFKNQLLTILKKEDDNIKQNIRFIQKKKPVKVRKRREYKPTPYVLFCREMKKNHPSNELAGRMQQLWREKNSVPMQVEKTKDPNVYYADISVED